MNPELAKPFGSRRIRITRANGTVVHYTPVDYGVSAAAIEEIERLEREADEGRAPAVVMQQELFG